MPKQKNVLWLVLLALFAVSIASYVWWEMSQSPSDSDTVAEDQNEVTLGSLLSPDQGTVQFVIETNQSGNTTESGGLSSSVSGLLSYTGTELSELNLDAYSRTADQITTVNDFQLLSAGDRSYFRVDELQIAQHNDDFATTNYDAITNRWFLANKDQPITSFPFLPRMVRDALVSEDDTSVRVDIPALRDAINQAQIFRNLTETGEREERGDITLVGYAFSELDPTATANLLRQLNRNTRSDRTQDDLSTLSAELEKFNLSGTIWVEEGNRSQLRQVDLYARSKAGLASIEEGGKSPVFSLKLNITELRRPIEIEPVSRSASPFPEGLDISALITSDAPTFTLDNLDIPAEADFDQLTAE